MNLRLLLFIAGCITLGLIFGIIVDKSMKSVPNKKPEQIYVTLIIDGCEYIRIEPDGNSLCHKGNCTNSIHR